MPRGDTAATATVATAATPPSSADAMPAEPMMVSDTASPPDTIRFSPQGRPLLPAVFHGACEGEDCRLQFDAIACAPVSLQALPQDSAHVVGRVEVGDTVFVSRRELHLVAPGLVVLKRDFVLDSYNAGDGPKPMADTVRFTNGDTAYLLHYDELGEWELGYRGKRHIVDEFWAGPAVGLENGLGGAMENKDSSTAVALSQPTTADWWRVMPKRGHAGWWRADRALGLASIDDLQKDGLTCEALVRGP